MSYQDDIDNFAPVIAGLQETIDQITTYQTWCNSLADGISVADFCTALDANSTAVLYCGESSNMNEGVTDEDVASWIVKEKDWCTTTLASFNELKTNYESKIAELQAKIAGTWTPSA